MDSPEISPLATQRNFTGGYKGNYKIFAQNNHFWGKVFDRLYSMKKSVATQWSDGVMSSHLSQGDADVEA